MKFYTRLHVLGRKTWRLTFLHVVFLNCQVSFWSLTHFSPRQSELDKCYHPELAQASDPPWVCSEVEAPWKATISQFPAQRWQTSGRSRGSDQNNNFSPLSLLRDKHLTSLLISLCLLERFNQLTEVWTWGFSCCFKVEFMGEEKMGNFVSHIFFFILSQNCEERRYPPVNMVSYHYCSKNFTFQFVF